MSNRCFRHGSTSPTQKKHSMFRCFCIFPMETSRNKNYVSDHLRTDAPHLSKRWWLGSNSKVAQAWEFIAGCPTAYRRKKKNCLKSLKVNGFEPVSEVYKFGLKPEIQWESGHGSCPAADVEEPWQLLVDLGDHFVHENPWGSSTARPPPKKKATSTSTTYQLFLASIRIDATCLLHWCCSLAI